jgi:hypothetical protein
MLIAAMEVAFSSPAFAQAQYAPSACARGYYQNADAASRVDPDGCGQHDQSNDCLRSNQLSAAADDAHDAAMEAFIEERRQQALAMIAKMQEGE